MVEAGQLGIIAALLDARRYPHPSGSVLLFEPHVSWVLLAGRYAYKIKKAIHPEFLDFRKLDDRKFFCDEEIRLNGRLAPEIYIEVVPIGGSSSDPVIGKIPAIEYAVKMWRFDPERTLDKLLEKGKLRPSHVDRLAKKIALFHENLAPASPDSGFGGGLLEVARASFRELRKHWGEGLSALEGAIETEHEKNLDCFAERLEKGYVRECHGDLHLGNIALMDEEPVPFDGIEFDKNLRWIDVANEIAFPVMDLVYHGRSDLAWRLLNSYLEITGDYSGMQVFRFYFACRALVRAMVDAMRDDKASAKRHLDLASESLFPPHPFLIVTCGLPGSGKTTLSQHILERHGAIRLRSDLERKRLAGLKPLDKSGSPVDSGIYAGDFS
jgi:aminoglycoside phosphotransferase family enzyme